MDYGMFGGGNRYYQPPIHYEIIRVNGRAGAEAFRMAPNSSALLLDNTASMVWLAQTDGAGYLTVTPYDITPHHEQPPIDINDLAARITKLEENYAVQPNTSAAKSNKKHGNAEQQPSANQKSNAASPNSN